MSKISKIVDWVDKNGYPFELKVAKSFSRAGFDVAQSILFDDPNTHKLRETDIIAHTSRCMNGVWVNLTFVIECKSSKDKPWIAFMNDELKNLSPERLFVMASRNGRILTSEVSKNKDYISPLIFPPIYNMGYSLVRAFGGEKDIAYSAMQGILNATEFLVTKSNASNKKFCNIYFPVLAIEGELYKANINSDDEIVLNKIVEASIATIKSFAEQDSTFITVFSSESLDAFSKTKMHECEEFYERYSSELDIVTKENPYNSDFVLF